MVGAHGAEVVKVVGEMAEVAVEALEWRHERKVEKDIAKEWDWAEVESDLDCQRRDNQRLRATIAMYEQAFQQLHKEKADSGNLSVERSLAVKAIVMLREDLPSFVENHNVFIPCPRPNYSPPRVYEQLKNRVASPAFLDSLKLSLADGASTSSDNTLLKTEDGLYVKADVDDPNWWLWLSENDMDREPKEVQDGLGSDGYVIVTQEEIVDSISRFIARYISSIPQAKNLTPKELQLVMTQAFGKVEKKGRIQTLWTTGKFLYTAGSWGVHALSLYRHPIVIRAASMAVWTSCCLILKLIA